MDRLTHLDEHGNARMVDVGGKAETARVAVASGRIRMGAEALAAIRDGNAPKGDVLAAARIAGIMAAKKTAELIPLCHPLALDAVTVDFAFEADARPRHCHRLADRPDRGGNGSDDSDFHRTPDNLRHGQGARQGDGDRGRAPDRKARRQVRATGSAP